MAFTTCCTNKGCGKVQAPYLDPVNDKAYCSICHGEIGNLTYFAKSQMKSSKQFKPKSTNSFSVKCPHCKQEDRPKLDNQDNVVCFSCKKPLDNLSAAFKHMLKEELKKVNQDL